MNPMAAALANPTQAGPQRNRSNTRAGSPPPVPTVKRKTGADILRELAERQAQEAAQMRVATENDETRAAHDAQVEQVCGLYEADSMLTVQINDLNKQKGRHPKGSKAEETRLNALEQATNNLNIIREEMAGIEGEYPLAGQDGLKRFRRRLEAAQIADTNRRTTVTPTSIRGRIDMAVEAGFVQSTNQDDYEFVQAEAKKAGIPTPAFSFDRQYFMATNPWDAESVVAVSVSEMITDLQSFNNSEDDKIMNEVRRGDFYLSSRREPDGRGGNLPSGLDLFRKEPGVVRRATAFLSGKGQYYVARVGKEFVVIESRNKVFDGESFVGATFFAVKVTGPRTGRVLCTQPDGPRENGVRKFRSSPANIVKDKHTISPTDASGIWWDKLQQSFQETLQAEAETITFSELKDNTKGVCGVNVYWKTNFKDETSPDVHLRFKLEGFGNGTFQAKDVYQDALAKVDPKGMWLGKAFRGPQPLADLDTGKWPAVAGLNKANERDWQLDVLAQELDAERTSTENVDGLTSVENGKDGRYAVRAMIKKPAVNGDQKRQKNAVGYVIERSGSTVEIVDAVPGTSVSFARDLRGKHEIADLPWRLKVILGSQYYGVRHEDAPEHLRLTSKQQEVESTDTTAE